MKKLPYWSITDRFPAFYDHESATAIEQTAKVYAAMQTLIEEYNNFVDGVNSSVDEFMESSDKNYQAFTYEMAQKFQNFIDVIELKVVAQDHKINDAIRYMKNNLKESVTDLVLQMNQNGEFNDAVLAAIEDFDQKVQDVNHNFDESIALLEKNDLLHVPDENGKITLMIGSDVLVGQEITFTYDPNAGYTRTLSRGLDIKNFVVRGLATQETERTATYVIPSGYDEITFKQIKTIIICPIHDVLQEFKKKIEENTKQINAFINQNAPENTYKEIDIINTATQRVWVETNGVMAAIKVKGTFPAAPNQTLLCDIPPEIYMFTGFPATFTKNDVKFSFQSHVGTNIDSFLKVYYSTPRDTELTATTITTFILKYVPVLNAGNDHALLKDQSTGTMYKLYINNGSLLYEEV